MKSCPVDKSYFTCSAFWELTEARRLKVLCCCQHSRFAVPPISPAEFVVPPSGGPEEVPDGAQEQRGESGEMPGRAEEAAQEEPGQQALVQVRRQGDAGQSVALRLGTMM